MCAYKYPYISDKRMYAAVMGACSYIRDKGYFNKAVRYYADKYNVDEEELAKHIRERQSAGQKGKTANSKGRKYKWFVVCEICEVDGEKNYLHPEVLKGLTSKSVERRFSEADLKKTMQNDYGGNYAPTYYHIVLAQFDTEEEAKKALPGWQKLL